MRVDKNFGKQTKKKEGQLLEVVGSVEDGSYSPSGHTQEGLC